MTEPNYSERNDMETSSSSDDSSKLCEQSTKSIEFKHREKFTNTSVFKHEDHNLNGQSALALSVDIEDWYHVPAVTGSSFSEYDDVQEFFEEWDDEYDYLTKPTHRTLDLLDNLGVTATFFIVADVVDNYPGLVEEIADRGHEIGCHGLHHECAIDPDSKDPRFTKKEYAEQISRAKKKLEAASGQEVVGFRAPNAYVSGWVLDVIEDIGFKYDSSVAHNSLFNKTDEELVSVESEPYVPKKGSLKPGGERSLIELPWPYWELGPVKIPSGGGPLIRLFGEFIIKRGITQSLKRGPSSFYFHPLDIAQADFPKVGNTKRRPAYWLFKGEKTESRISSLIESIGVNRCLPCETTIKQWQSQNV